MKDKNISVLMPMAYIKRTDVKVLFSLTIIYRSIDSNSILFYLIKVEQKEKWNYHLVLY